MGDMSLISSAYYLSHFVRTGAISFDQVQSLPGIVLISSIYLSTFFLAELYDTEASFKSPKYIFRFLAALSIAGVIVAGLLYLAPPLRPDARGILFINTALVGILTYSWRLLFRSAFRDSFERQKKILVVGATPSGKALYDAIKRASVFKVVGFIDDGPHEQDALNSPGVIGSSKDFAEIVKKQKVDVVVIAIMRLKNQELLKDLTHCKMKGLEVYDMPGFYEELTGKVPVEHISDFWFINSPISGVKRSIYNKKIKRVLDIICSTLGLLAGLPAIIITSIAIKLESDGPILYRQTRVGIHGKTFHVFKFRSMKFNAEKNGAVWAKEKDDRVTKVGKIIRKFRIDETPQMWNVLKGEMSFLGPRPERPEFVEILKDKIPYFSLRFSIKPGITGWAQVNYPYGSSEKDALEKLQYDLFYIKNLSPLLDFHILFKTIKVVLFGRGGR